jgi:enoyl-CoA hydratase/carnithine racemase
MSDGLVGVTYRDAVAVVTLDDPPVNAMSNALLEELECTFRAVAHERDARAVVLTGAGTKAFAAGAKLPELAGMLDSSDDIAHHTGLSRRALDAVAQLPQPVIAAAQASAVGGGLELLLACDFAVVDERAKLGLPEVTLGLIPGAGGTQRLARRIGIQAATRLILLGDLVSAEEALRLGMITSVAPADQALEDACALAAKLGERPAAAVRAAKRALAGSADLPLPDGLLLERREFMRVLRTPDAREGVAAFLERRSPTFEHR